MAKVAGNILVANPERLMVRANAISNSVADVVKSFDRRVTTQ